jgi:YVTN family beta-propeller protein
MRSERLSMTAATIVLASASACHRGARSSPVVYATDEEGGSVLVVDPGTANVTARIAVGKWPRGLKASRDGKRL